MSEKILDIDKVLNKLKTMVPNYVDIDIVWVDNSGVNSYIVVEFGLDKNAISSVDNDLFTLAHLNLISEEFGDYNVVFKTGRVEKIKLGMYVTNHSYYF